VCLSPPTNETTSSVGVRSMSARTAWPGDSLFADQRGEVSERRPTRACFRTAQSCREVDGGVRVVPSHVQLRSLDALRDICKGLAWASERRRGSGVEYKYRHGGYVQVEEPQCAIISPTA
jgi:hypothetical protein